MLDVSMYTPDQEEGEEEGGGARTAARRRVQVRGETGRRPGPVGHDWADGV